MCLLHGTKSCSFGMNCRFTEATNQIHILLMGALIQCTFHTQIDTMITAACDIVTFHGNCWNKYICQVDVAWRRLLWKLISSWTLYSQRNVSWLQRNRRTFVLSEPYSNQVAPSSYLFERDAILHISYYQPNNSLCDNALAHNYIFSSWVWRWFSKWIRLSFCWRIVHTYRVCVFFVFFFFFYL